MKENEVVGQVINAIMSAPGMGKIVKIPLNMSCKTALLLNSIIQHGLDTKSEGKVPFLLANLSPKSVAEIKNIGKVCLETAELVDLYEKIDALHVTA